jgi:hypothetical protein
MEPEKPTVIRVYDKAGNVMETHERKGDFKEPSEDLLLLSGFRYVGRPLVYVVTHDI